MTNCYYATKSLEAAPHTRRPRARRSASEALRNSPEDSRTRIDRSWGLITVPLLLLLLLPLVVSTKMKRRLPCSYESTRMVRFFAGGGGGGASSVAGNRANLIGRRDFLRTRAASCTMDWIVDDNSSCIYLKGKRASLGNGNQNWTSFLLWSLGFVLVSGCLS